MAFGSSDKNSAPTFQNTFLRAKEATIEDGSGHWLFAQLGWNGGDPEREVFERPHAHDIAKNGEAGLLTIPTGSLIHV